ncbi:MAG TPA: TIGR02680 family protein, partial [Pseudonocardiaceae bacterium]|nr:TIGR02680 family protein [Pseudonocardiaceae bacterium]
RGLAEARTAADAFLTHYRRYAGVAAKRCAAPPRRAHSRYEQHSQDLGAAESAYQAADQALAAATVRLGELAAVRTVLEARRVALEQSPEMRNARELTKAGEDATRLRGFAVDRESERRKAVEAALRWEGRLADALRDAEIDATACQAAGDTASAAAEAALISTRHAAVLAELATDTPPYARAIRAGADAIDRQTAAVSQLDTLLRSVTAAETALRSARVEVDRITAERQAAIDRIIAAETATTDQARQLIDAYTGYFRDTVEIRVGDQDDVLAALESWTETLTGPNPAAGAVLGAVRRATEELGRRRAEVDARRDDLWRTHARLADEIARLAAGGHDTPPVPHTRDASGRAGRPGAPFWQVVDFTDGVSDQHRAGIEAALEAAGILDAWVTPDGDLRDPIHDDVIVRAVAAPAPAGGLTAVLTPAIDRGDPLAAGLTDTGVNSVLAAIGLGPGGTTWVGVDGRFANGPLTGTWHKDTAVHIGDGAREAARRARLAALHDELADVDGQLAEMATTEQRLTARADTLTTEQRAQPSDAALREAHIRVAAEHDAKRRVDEHLTRAEEVVGERADKAVAARTEAAEFAGDVGLPPTDAELASIRAALGDYRVALAGLWPAAHAVRRARDEAARAEQELTDAVEHREQRDAAAVLARDEADAAEERHRVLLASAGAGVDELHRKLAEVADELIARDESERDQHGIANKAREARGKADGQRETLRASITEAVDERDSAINALRAFVATGLLHTVLPDLDVPDPAAEWAPTPAIGLARAINAALEHIDDADRPWELVQQRVTAEHKLLTDALSRHGHSVGMTVRDGIIVVDVLFQGRRQDVPTLLAGLLAETEHRATLLSAKEREILENHLINEVAGTLQELISGAEEQVRAINADLADRPTSTGMRLRLHWRLARTAPDGLAAVRDRLLRQTSDAWSAADRAAVGGFLQERINTEHAQDSAGGWAEQLTRALDYRAWHEFAIQRYQDGQWRPATGPASGGERVLAASVPLFAAASSFYTSSGNPHVPRLIALDEAFAGVDDDSRAKCLGLLAAFDLDVVMTSEREWGCYPQVPGLAIAQLARRDGIDAVLVTPWRWDGSQRRPVDRPQPYTPQPYTPPRVPDGDSAEPLFT